MMGLSMLMAPCHPRRSSTGEDVVAWELSEKPMDDSSSVLTEGGDGTDINFKLFIMFGLGW